MGLIKIINAKKFILISLSLLLYVMLNLFDGERGLISYHDKQKKLENLILEKQIIISKLKDIRKKNDLLTNNIDLDYIEILYRNKFMLGKPTEKIFYK
jgi:cell division protein DivIC|tara:strand:- start:230 stop:523 length:294 start_codon:yes stop_codon:yes gene_type:complete